LAIAVCLFCGVGEESIRSSSEVGRYGVEMSSLRAETVDILAKVRRSYTPVFYSCCI
jgi:hypothetical protein